ncbi:hypothetical protein E2C01_011060 [Portunus trituberculatus]|uniref:Uncharacterized protein n=1 Tax=Portunus trituberculatus TaxID=210409 RepID=A0A5B7DAI6_PORTR|nr:hypothetical protein [Portunus trituberculatus]
MWEWNVGEERMLASSKSSHLLVDARKYIQYEILDKFTEEAGSTPLYVTRGFVAPTPCGWPIPHDAPYKAQLDRLIVAIMEVSDINTLLGDLSTCRLASMISGQLN